MHRLKPRIDTARRKSGRAPVPATIPFIAPLAGLSFFGILVTASPAALAYVGPGAGLGLLGVVVAVLAAVVMGFLGLVMWPIRKIAQQRKAHAHGRSEAAASSERAPSRRPSEGSVKGHAREEATKPGRR